MSGTYYNAMTALVGGNRLDVDSYDVGRAIVTLSIEKSLIDIGKTTHDAVLDKITHDGTTIDVFYKNPEYLTNLLRNLFGTSYTEILKSIKNNLDEFSDQEQIRNFINSLN
jgi:hypothetical protein